MLVQVTAFPALGSNESRLFLITPRPPTQRTFIDRFKRINSNHDEMRNKTNSNTKIDKTIISNLCSRCARPQKLSRKKRQSTKSTKNTYCLFQFPLAPRLWYNTITTLCSKVVLSLQRVTVRTTGMIKFRGRAVKPKSSAGSLSPTRSQYAHLIPAYNI